MKKLQSSLIVGGNENAVAAVQNFGSSYIKHRVPYDLIFSLVVIYTREVKT